MLTDGTGPVTRVMTVLALVGAGALTPAWALAQAAGTEAGLSTRDEAPAPATDAIARARALMDRGRLIEARNIAAASLPRALDLPADQRRDIVELIQSIDSKLRTADPVEMTL